MLGDVEVYYASAGLTNGRHETAAVCKWVCPKKSVSQKLKLRIIQISGSIYAKYKRRRYTKSKKELEEFMGETIKMKSI